MTSEQRQFARHLRKHGTKAEDVLWQALRGRRLDDLKFRRQAPVLTYTVGFLCAERKLVVEIDGKQHDWYSEYDQHRTREIEAQGLLVIRATNAEVLTDLDVVLNRVRDAASPFSRLGE
ncbi:endonuclease domain-containing protein [Salinarimonas ramus]|uniref:DNA methyltransferase n=1 Tax=Salinarimonas ramus TaxID=690164 RepID=A0A917Q402_9HYPH|nr:DUF559 domain-containing protein [Salinarimonas ramus]GGK22190.1 DNA methyltransferase [Salinarimonas ramus]